MHHNFLFDLDMTLLDFHASERKALEIVITECGLKFTEECYDHFKAYNKALWLELEKGTITRTEFFDMVLEGVNEPKETCIVIGDSLSSDMQGAKNASLASVWFMPSGNIEEAQKAYDINYCASSFDELYEVLLKWVEK